MVSQRFCIFVLENKKFMEIINKYDSVFVIRSLIPSIKEGKIYSTLKRGENLFIFDETGKKQKVLKTKLQFKMLDAVVMIVKINFSLLKTVETNKFYRVFDDQENDERYIFDKNNEKVLFDKMIFQYELI